VYVLEYNKKSKVNGNYFAVREKEDGTLAQTCLYEDAVQFSSVEIANAYAQKLRLTDKVHLQRI
jgi:hypothetical protein